MASPSRDSTLLALLLALKNLKVPLSEAEQAKFFEIGEQLELDPDDWDFIYEGTIDTIAKNPSLNQLFEAYVLQLKCLSGSIPPSLLPTEIELEQELFASSNIEKRGYFEGNPDLQNNEILNVSIPILTSDNAAAKAKQLTFLDKIQNFLTPSTNQGKSNP